MVRKVERFIRRVPNLQAKRNPSFTIAFAAGQPGKGVTRRNLMRQLAQEPRTRVLPARMTTSTASTRRSPMSWRASTRWGTPRRTTSVMARFAASSSRSTSPTSRRARSGATTPRRRVEHAPADPVRGRGGRVRDSFRAAGSLGRPHGTRSSIRRARHMRTAATRRAPCAVCETVARHLD